MRYESNISQVSDRLQAKLNSLSDPNILRKVAVHLRSTNDKRVFDDGVKADGSPIGVYSTSYMTTRKKKGFTSSTRVILRFDGLLKEDLKVIALSDGWGVGFTTPRSAEIIPHLEEKYGTKIWGISAQDSKDIDQLLDNELRNKLK